MKTYTAGELAEIIEKHGKWLRLEDGGERADLSCADLRSADLRSADLSSANLRSADLSCANLRYADLSSADLSSANLRYADLRSADLSSADLSSANLRHADLRSADLSSANLRYADLRSADLSSADLSSANLRHADLISLIGNMSEIKSMQCDLWLVSYTSDILNIGCQTHTFAEWWGFSDDEIARMDSKALTWWNVWKPILQKIIKVSPATPCQPRKDGIE